MNKNIIAIIPARGGSKGIKNKNIIELNEKPLIYYTIKAALESKIFSKIIVSTDSKKIAEISEKYGAEIPFLRPDYLSNDSASSLDVICHTLNFFKNKNKHFESFMLLQPTSPLRTSKNILESVELFENKKANSVVSVCEMEHSPLWSNTINKDLKMDNFENPKYKDIRRQDLPNHYRINGAIYLSKVNYYLKYKYWFQKNSFAYIMNRINSVDIDEEIDLKFAELIMRDNYEKNY